MIAIVHSRDLDGHTSGAIIKKRHPEAKIFGYDYGEPLPFEVSNITLGDEAVIMADVSLPMDKMVDLASASRSFTWIDHHISAIKEYNEKLKDVIIPGMDHLGSTKPKWITPVLESGISACEGTWKHLFPEDKMPRAVQLLGEYDTWRNKDMYKWNNEILPFQFGMRLLCNSVESFPMELLNTNEDPHIDQLIDEIISKGLVILKYQDQVNEANCKKAAFEFDFMGLRAICLNGGGFNSDVFKSVYDESKHDIMMPFQFNGKFWTISLYTTKPDIDCSVIAKSKGGGGHAKAAGFQVDDIKSIFYQL